MIVSMPDGQKVNFPDDMPREQIKSLILSKYPDIQSPEAATQKPTGIDLREMYAAQGKMPDVNLDRGNAVLRGGLQGVTRGYGDEAAAALESFFTDKPYEQARDEYRQKNAAASEAYPGSYTVGQIGGSIASPARSIGAIGLEGALQGSGLSEAESVPDLAKDTAIGGAIGLTGGAVAKGIGKGVNALRPGKVAFTAQEMRELASNAYKQADSMGEILPVKQSDLFLDNMKLSLPSSTEKKIRESVVGEIPAFNISKVLEEYRGKPLTYESADTIDKSITKVLNSPRFVHPNGKLTTEGQEIYDIQTKFRNMIDDATIDNKDKSAFQIRKQANKLWSASRKLEDIENIFERASMVDNPATSIKAGFRNLYMNKKRLRPYTAKERELIKKAATSNAAADLLRTVVGSRLNTIISASTGNLGAAAAAQAASMAARGAAERVQAKKLNDVAREIINNVKE